MKDGEKYITSFKERRMLVIEAERLLYGDSRPPLRNTRPTALLSNQSLALELAQASEGIIRKVIGSKDRKHAQLGSGVDYRVAVEVADAKTTVSVATPNDSGQRDARIAHYSEKTVGGIDTQVLEVVTLRSNGQLSISTEITSTGFDGAINWRTSFPSKNNNELTQDDIARARDLVMKANSLKEQDYYLKSKGGE